MMKAFGILALAADVPDCHGGALRFWLRLRVGTGVRIWSPAITRRD